jgi:hypothetical protein
VTSARDFEGALAGLLMALSALAGASASAANAAIATRPGRASALAKRMVPGFAHRLPVEDEEHGGQAHEDGLIERSGDGEQRKRGEPTQGPRDPAVADNMSGGADGSGEEDPCSSQSSILRGERYRATGTNVAMTSCSALALSSFSARSEAPCGPANLCWPGVLNGAQGPTQSTRGRLLKAAHLWLAELKLGDPPELKLTPGEPSIGLRSPREKLRAELNADATVVGTVALAKTAKGLDDVGRSYQASGPQLRALMRGCQVNEIALWRA